MGVFNFIETFFFISLGITFVLILLLVYHFKQRLNSIEQKNDTMFEIINNIVTEITRIKQYCLQPRQPIYIPASVNGMSATSLSATSLSVSNPTKTQLESISELVPISQNNKISEDFEDSTDNESGSEDESEDDESMLSSSDEDSIDSNDDDIHINKQKIIVSDDELETFDHTDKNIKIISLDTLSIKPTPDLELHIVQLAEDPVTPVDTAIQINNQDVDQSIEQLTEVISDIVEIESTFSESTQIESTFSESITIHLSPKDKIMETYSKMSSSELKAIIIQKGLNTEPSKLKRPRLLQLLEKSIE